MRSCLLQEMKILTTKEGNYLNIKDLYDIMVPHFVQLPHFQDNISNAELNKHITQANMRCDLLNVTWLFYTQF